MEITLTIMDRVSLPNILKKEADYKTLIINRDILKKVELTQDEMKEVNFRTTPPDASGKAMSMWNEKDTVIDFTEMEVAEIKCCLTEIESQKRLSQDTVHLYESFCL